jgi:hypothetical protein
MPAEDVDKPALVKYNYCGMFDRLLFMWTNKVMIVVNDGLPVQDTEGKQRTC